MLRAALVMVVMGLAVAEARAQPPADAGAPPDGSGPPGDGGTAAPPSAEVDLSAPPIPLARAEPSYPLEAQRAGIEGEVVLLLTIDGGGIVTDVAVEVGLPGGLTESATALARALRFRPALDRAGHPIAVRLRWKVHFTLPERRGPAAPPAPPAVAASPPASPPPATPPVPTVPPNVERFATGEAGLLVVNVRERGTGKRLPLAIIWIEDVGEVLHVDAAGHAQRALAPGAYALTVRAPGHHQEERIERLHAGERLERTYFIERERLNEYETIVHAPPMRAETGVVTLQAEEIHGLPGTFGDPFRAVMLLPGVGSAISGLGYPIVRGEAPGQTGTFIDDVKIPLLYHLGFLSAVVHPLYLESLDFHAGAFPAEFGRFTGGLIRAKTTGAPEERQTMLSADLLEFSGYHAQPFSIGGHEGAISAAARYGTLSFLARAIDPNNVLRYWDFQTRADLRVGGGALRLLVFGANDGVGTAEHADETGVTIPEKVLHVGFNRADLRYRLFRRGRVAGDVGIEAGPDYTTNTDPATPARLFEWIVRPRANADVDLGPHLALRVGADTLYQSWTANNGGSLAETLFPRFGLTYGAFAQVEWKPTPGWLIVPGVRGNLYDYHFLAERTLARSLDPRLAIRRRLRPGLFVKVAGGIYHSPPRFLVPWPGLEGFGLRENGLNKSDQISGGVEADLPGDISINGQVYFNWLERVSEYELTRFEDTADGGLPKLARGGRAYGLELIARRRLGHRLFGWVTYTLSRAERNFPGLGWRPADFDQPHIVNAVASYALGRSWTVSGTFHLNSGRPVTPDAVITGNRGTTLETLQENRNLNRLPMFWRADVRIEKREAFDTWFLDFYVDWLNISLQREFTSYTYSIDPTTQAVLRRPRGEILTIPTIGLRVVF